MSDEARLESPDEGVGYRVEVRLTAAQSQLLDDLMQRESLPPGQALARALEGYARVQQRIHRRELVRRFASLHHRSGVVGGR